MSLVPPVIGLFTRLLRERGHTVSLFDCTGYDFEGKADPEVEREKNLFVKPSESASDRVLRPKLTNMYCDFVSQVEDFNPTLIAMSVTESTFLRGVTLLEYLRSVKRINVLTIVGGVFATFAPERVIRESSIDIVCVGEGENALIELCNRLSYAKDFSKVPNLWVKISNGDVVRNAPGPPVDMNELPPIDFSIFEDDRFYRPMRGKIYRMLPVETHRGCPYTCTFCNSPAQNTLYRTHTQSSFFRKKPIEKIREELTHFRDIWGGEYVFFWADTFLAWGKRELQEFCEMYEEFKFPFWCQSRTETVSDAVGGSEKLRMLKEVGLHHMSFGMEHGNEKFRGDVIDRKYTNDDAVDALKNTNKFDIPVTINNIIGFPDETRELAMDTVKINRRIDSYNLSCSTFSPFRGTELRKKAEKSGFIDPEVLAPANTDWSILDMPKFTKKEIYGLQRVFAMYVKFPMNRWAEIEQAEELSPTGDAIWSELREEFLSEYLQDTEPAINKVNN